ncbi:hypothetical protein GCM10023084_38040 [Streptomyces lacrimifluminis]|uniref:Uncharacterized protein n=1 Tax=Streptomyces lacrimifluminis TaxID=1500077 RepID=A0A917L2L0_9ACTN|nr:hypothetical protein GCM10012282_39660 [Streptomyces lacrimifluminis]
MSPRRAHPGYTVAGICWWYAMGADTDITDLPGIEQLLDDEGKKTHRLDHPRAGELAAVAEPDAWFTYSYWRDDAHVPDFAQLVEIHREPGYDPVELFMDPRDPFVKVKAATAPGPPRQEARPALPRGGRAPGSLAYSRQPRPPPDERRRRSAPHLLHPPRAVDGRIAATDVTSLLLRPAGLS